MRCIEIVPADVCVNNTIRLTLTWDVLKSVFNIVIHCDCLGLTLTWDVLKSPLLIATYNYLCD